VPWQERNKLELRKDFVIKAMEPGCNFSELCREYEISRQQGYKWLKRFKEKGVTGLKDASRAPRTQALSTDSEIVFEVLDWKRAHPRWGPEKIQSKLAASHNEPPSIRTVARILARAGLVKKRSKRVVPQARPTNAPKTDAKDPNDLWTVDFKGWWLTGDKKRCEPLTIRDQASRFVFAVQILPSTKGVYVREVFNELFATHGLPKAILSDNGSPFGCTRALQGYTSLSAWFVSLGIEVRFSRPGCPQDNGAHERMHGDIRFDLEDNPSSSLEAQQAACDAWRHEFNHVRPHGSLNLKTPREVYKKSDRPFKAQLFAPARSVSLRRVNQVGRFSWQDHRVHLGRAFAGYNVGIEAKDNGQYHVCFFEKQLGYFDLRDERLAVHPHPEEDAGSALEVENQGSPETEQAA
jgi:putative transposase